MARDHREVVADEQRSPCPLSAPRLASRSRILRLHGDVERGRRLVGDDAASGRRPAPSRSSRAAARRPKARRDRRARAVRDRAAARGSSSSHRLRAAPPASGQAAMQDQRLGDLRADAMQRVQRRHRLLKDHRDAVAAQAPHLGFAGAGKVAPLEADRAARLCAPSGSRPISASAVIVLPEPDSPTTPRLSPRSSENETSRTTRRALRRRQVDGEVCDFEQHSAPRPQFGSSASRRPSPSRLRPSTESATARPGKIASRGAA